MATDTPNNLLFSQGNIFVVYDTTIFGSNMVSRGAITATRGTIDSFYTLSLSDSAPNILKLTLVHDSTNHLTNLDSVNTNQQLCHLRINISSFNLTSVGAYFDTLAMAGASLYQSTPNGVALPYDKVLVSGLRASHDLDAQITNVSYTSSYPQYLTFNVQIEDVAPLYDVDITIAYNTANFGTSPTLTCTKSSGLGIYDLGSSVSSGSIDIKLSPDNSNYPTYVPDGSSFPVPNDFSSYTTIATCSLSVVSCCYSSGAYISTSSVSGDYAYQDGTLQDDGMGDYYYDIDDDAYSTSGVSGSYDNSAGICPSGTTPNITSIGPNPISAGTFSVLTINGTGFGCGPGYIEFPDADNGGNGTMTTTAGDIVSWTDGQIQVMVPSTNAISSGHPAGSGTFIVHTSGGATVSSPQPLTIDYAVLNGRYDAISTNPAAPIGLGAINGAGGISFTPNNIFTTNSTLSSGNALTVVTHAMNDWKCETGVNFTMNSPSATPSTWAVGDGYSSITFGSMIAGAEDGTIAFTYISGLDFRQCSLTAIPNIPETDPAIVVEVDIVFDQSMISPAILSDPTWDYTNIDGSFIYSPGISLLEIARHEFGHAGLIQHCMLTSNLMYYAGSGTNSNIKTIQTQDGLAGVYVLEDQPSSWFGSCNGTSLNTQSSFGGCTIINSIQNISGEDHIALSPNPFSDQIILKGELGVASDVKINIYDILGQNILFSDYGTQNGTFEGTINTERLSEGIYLIAVTINENNQTYKFIKH